MTPYHTVLTLNGFADAALKSRRDVAGFLETARNEDSAKDLRAWEKELKKYDKLIAQYGLDTNAS